MPPESGRVASVAPADHESRGPSRATTRVPAGEREHQGRTRARPGRSRRTWWGSRPPRRATTRAGPREGDHESPGRRTRVSRRTRAPGQPAGGRERGRGARVGRGRDRTTSAGDHESRAPRGRPRESRPAGEPADHESRGPARATTRVPAGGREHQGSQPADESAAGALASDVVGIPTTSAGDHESRAPRGRPRESRPADESTRAASRRTRVSRADHESRGPARATTRVPAGGRG
ncbi:hypothetical protein TESS_TESS_00848 [Tessaracoccus sp. O5.2]